MSNDESTNPLKKQMQKQAETEAKKTKVYTLSYNINNAVADTIVVGAQNIPKALEKFLIQYGETSDDWNSMAITISETQIL